MWSVKATVSDMVKTCQSAKLPKPTQKKQNQEQTKNRKEGGFRGLLDLLSFPVSSCVKPDFLPRDMLNPGSSRKLMKGFETQEVSIYRVLNGKLQ